MEKNICDKPGVPPIAVSEWMNFRQPILKTCGHFYDWHV